MKVKIWTVAADDRFGTRASVHTTEGAAYEQWLEWRFHHEFSEEDDEEKALAAAFIQNGDYDGLWAWVDESGVGEPFDTYAIDVHEIEIPRQAAV